MGDPFWPVLVFRPAAVRAVLRSAWPTWAALIGFSTAFGVGALFGDSTKESILFAGTTLEVLGLGLVAKGLRDIRRLFDRPSLATRIIAWFRAFGAAFQPPPPIMLSGKAALGIAGAATGTLSRAPRPNATLEERVLDLEADVAALRSMHTQLATTTRDKLGSINRSLAVEAQERSAADAEVQARVEKFATGGLQLETVGVVWLLVGILTSNVPEQVAALLAQLFNRAA